MKNRIEIIQENKECFAVYVKEISLYAQFATIKDAAKFAVEIAEALGIDQ